MEYRDSYSNKLLNCSTTSTSCKLQSRSDLVVFCLLFSSVYAGGGAGATYEIHPATIDSREEFETVANALKPGDELYTRLDKGAFISKVEKILKE